MRHAVQPSSSAAAHQRCRTERRIAGARARAPGQHRRTLPTAIVHVAPNPPSARETGAPTAPAPLGRTTG